ncbi:uncharacterized protein [Amphiura filiformis]|uniref:uncharacterized protein n=1 Tax=Amphiura filiformis TaxID=82378 RepID=UPI003B20EF26
MEYSNHSELKRIYLWANNRSLSTVFLKCLSNVPDCQIVNGIFTSCFFFGEDPTSEQPLSSKEKCKSEASTYDFSDFPYVYEGSTSTYSWAKSQLEGEYPEKKYLVCKDLPFALSGNHSFLPEGFRHTFLIRHPFRMFQSWKNSPINRHYPISNLYDIINTYYKKQFNYKEQYDILTYLQDHVELGDQNPVIIDADDLQNHPASVLSQYCEAVGLPYTDDLLQWRPGNDVVKNWKTSQQLVAGGLYGEEGKGYWHSAIESSQFLPARKLPERSELSDDVLACADMSMSYYEELYRMRTIRP